MSLEEEVVVVGGLLDDAKFEHGVKELLGVSVGAGARGGCPIDWGSKVVNLYSHEKFYTLIGK